MRLWFLHTGLCSDSSRVAWNPIKSPRSVWGGKSISGSQPTPWLIRAEEPQPKSYNRGCCRQALNCDSDSLQPLGTQPHPVNSYEHDIAQGPRVKPTRQALTQTTQDPILLFVALASCSIPLGLRVLAYEVGLHFPGSL